MILACHGLTSSDMSSFYQRQRPTGDAPMTAEQAALLKQLAHEAYEPDAFKPHLTRTEAELRIAVVKAKLKFNLRDARNCTDCGQTAAILRPRIEAQRSRGWSVLERPGYAADRHRSRAVAR
jgi:Protein of unknown function (DUF3072)